MRKKSGVGRQGIAIRLENIRLHGFHGTAESEKKRGGPFLLSLEASCTAPRNLKSDALEDYLDYAALAARAEELFSEKRFNLMESLARRIARELLREFPLIRRLTVRLRKLKPVMPQKLDFAEVEVTKSFDRPERAKHVEGRARKRR